MKSILNLRYLLALAIAVTLFSSCGKDDDGGTSTAIVGCMDSEADNYNANATEDSGNCIFFGCMNPEAENFDADATDDSGECIFFRDKFIGMYEGSMTFAQLGGSLNQDSIDFSITPGISSINEVLVGVTIQSLPVFLTGIASADGLAVDYVYNIPDGAAINPILDGEPVQVIFSGLVTTADNGQNIGGDLNVTFKTPQNDDIADIVDIATLTGTKK